VVKKSGLLPVLLAVALASCATFEPRSPAFYIEPLPAEVTSRLTLGERIEAEDVWGDLQAGRAEQAAKRLQRLGPDSPVYYAGLGFVDLERGDLAGAEQAFQTAIRGTPDLVLGHLGLAQVYEKQGRDDLLFSQYLEILKLAPDHPWVKPRFQSLRDRKTEEFLGLASAAGDAEAAKKDYLSALFFHPESVEAHLGLAELYRKEKNISSALLHLKSAVAARPKDEAPLRAYAETLFEAGQFGRSLEAYETLAGLAPEDKTVEARLAELKDRLGVVELPDLYYAIPKSEAVTREELSALVAVKFKDELGSPPAKPRISVDIATSWAARFILQTTAFGLMDPYDNHTFQPRKPVNRAEFAETLSRLIAFFKGRGRKLIPQIPPERIQIADLATDSFYVRPVTEAVSYQILELSAQRTFRPDAPVAGEEAIRALDLLLALIR
jgi:Tfp pilus assembly protein PilF